MGAYEGVVPLLHEAVVVFVIGATASQLYPSDFLSKEVEQGTVQEFGAVVGWISKMGKGQRETTLVKATFISRALRP